MAVSVSMPQLGESVSEGTVTRWLKKEGERVERDEPLLEISTDKVDTEIPSPAAGILRSIAVAEDETVAVGAELATIDEGDDASQAAPAPAAPAPDQAPAPPAAPAPAQQETPQAQAPAPPAPPAQAGPPQPPAAPAAQQQPQPQTAPYQPPVRQAPQAPAPPAPPAAPVQAQPPAQVQQPPAQQPPAQQPTPSATSQALPSGPDGPYVTPLVRKLASEHEVDLAEVSGTGVGGRIRKQDVLDAARARREAASTAQQQPAPGPGFATGGAAPAPAPRLDVVPSSLRGTTERISRLRQVIAQRMVESLQTSAQLTTVAEADVTGIARLRERAKADFEAREGVRLS